ncbi:hypothetical protein DMC01_01795 [Campylobacter troglodytis]|nr:hypothetical protein DMC01_01795 [Campylobacter troglodytis]
MWHKRLVKHSLNKFKGSFYTLLNIIKILKQILCSLDKLRTSNKQGALKNKIYLKKRLFCFVKRLRMKKVNSCLRVLSILQCDFLAKSLSYKSRLFKRVF